MRAMNCTVRNSLAGTIAVVLQAILWTLPAPAAAQGSWTFVAPMQNARNELGAAVGSDGRIYAIGGGFDGVHLSTVEAYDIATDTWSSVASTPTGRDACTASSDVGGVVYVFGGSDSQGVLESRVDSYDPATNTWTQRSSMPTARTYSTSVTGKDGLIYVIGGTTPQLFATDVAEAYNPQTDTWTVLPPMPTARVEMGAAVAPDGKIYVFGGSVLLAPFVSAPVDTVEVYDPATGAWSTAPSMPYPRTNTKAATGPDGRIYIIGDTIINEVDAYDTVTRTWTAVAPLSVPRNRSALVTAPDGRIYAIGGNGGDNTTFSSVEAFSLQQAIVYGVNALYDQTKVHKSGSTIPIKLQLLDGLGVNVSAPSIVVTALTVTRVSDSATGALDDSGNSNPDYNFRYDASLGDAGGYVFNLSTKGFSTGQYRVFFQAGEDKSQHSVDFQVR
jgi:hypothetical protein